MIDALFYPVLATNGITVGQQREPEDRDYLVHNISRHLFSNAQRDNNGSGNRRCGTNVSVPVSLQYASGNTHSFRLKFDREEQHSAARKATNVELFRRKVDRKERPSEGAPAPVPDREERRSMVAMAAASSSTLAPLHVALQAPLSAYHHGDEGRYYTTVKAALETENSTTIIELAAAAEPLPTSTPGHWSKFQCGVGFTLCLLVAIVPSLGLPSE